MHWRKIKKRAPPLVTHALSVLLLPCFGLIISLAVVRWASVGLWGEFAVLSAGIQIAMQIAIWGNKDYLLREISFHPDRLMYLWQTQLWTRALCVLPALLGAGWLLGYWTRPSLVIWIVCWFFYQSFDILVLYKKRFAFSITTESLGLCIVILGIAYYRDNLNLQHLVSIYSTAYFFKLAAAFIYWFGTIFNKRFFKIRTGILRLSLPFLLLSFTGLLQIKVDVLCLDHFLSSRDTGSYQVFWGFLIYLKNGAYFLVAPYLKGIYRLPTDSMKRYAGSLARFGLLAVPPGLFIIYLLVFYLYGIDLHFTSYLLGGLLTIPYYCYFPKINELIRSEKYYTIFWVNTLGIAINILLNLWLIPRYAINGALAGHAISQWLVWSILLALTNPTLRRS